MFLVNGKEIKIDTSKKPYNQGSEGKCYKIGDKIYKIYFPSMLYESGIAKEKHHRQLQFLNSKQIVLPIDFIYNENGEYVGYVTKYIEADQKKKNGILLLPSETLVENIQTLEEDFDLLSENSTMCADVSPINFLLGDKMYIIDPGRYKTNVYSSEACQRQNNEQLEQLISLLLYNDLLFYKPILSKVKLQKIRDKLIEKKGERRFSEFLNEETVGYENLFEYSKSLQKYIR